jgi:hypothetical protein
MSDTRRFVALLLAAMAVGLVLFGVVRGLSSTGPAQGTRFIVTIGPPVDNVAVATCEQVVHARLPQARVVPTSEGLVVEIPSWDLASWFAAKIQLGDSGHCHMHIASEGTFTRATGFVPRAWPFVAAAAVLLAVGALLWRRR